MNIQPMKTPKQSTTKIPSAPSIDYDRLLDMSNQTLAMDMAPPVEQSQLDTAAGYRDLGSLAAALSGAVRGAGSVGGKLPDDFGFPQIARDLGNSRTMDLQNRMALRKQQENDMLEAIKNSGIAQQAKLAAERRAKPISDRDRAIATKRLRDALGDPKFQELPAEMTYGDIEDEPFLADILGVNNGTSGMSEYQKVMTGLRKTEVEAAIDARNREIAGKTVTREIGVNEESRKTSPVDRTVMAIIRKRMLEQGYKPEEIPDSITVEQSTQEPYKSLLSGAFMSQNQQATQTRLGADGKPKKLTEQQELKAMESLTKNLGQGGYTEAWEAMNKLKEILAKYPKGKNIPGVGVGGAFNLGAAYERFTNDDAKEIERTAATLANIKINNRSGKAVTVQEFERLKPELGSGTWRNETNFRNAIDAAYKALVSRTRDQIAPYKKSGVYQTWVESGEGTDYEQFLPKGVGIAPGNEGIPKEALDKSKDAYNGMMKDAIEYTPKPGAAPQGGAPKEVRKITKDGRTAIFDAETKRFIRYAD